MESLRIDIINPKAKSLINNLADLKLIRIRKETEKSDFELLLEKLRNNADNAPSIEEISNEVNLIRKARNE